MTKIVVLRLNTIDAESYKDSIRAIVETHERETEPFIIIALYEENPQNRERIPLALQLTGTLRVMAAVSRSQWTRQMVAINPSTDSHWLIRFAMQIWGQDWHIDIAPDMDTARQIAEDWIKIRRLH